jgi:transcriptional regulator with XRE-family HTH domain
MVVLTTKSLSLDDVIRREIAEDEGAAAGYLLATLTNDVIAALREARMRAGLTQADMARRTHTTQSAVAALEGDIDGSPSFRRMARYFLAAGFVPGLVLERVESLSNVALASLDAVRPFVKFEATGSIQQGQAGPSMLNCQAEKVDPINLAASYFHSPWKMSNQLSQASTQPQGSWLFGKIPHLEQPESPGLSLHGQTLSPPTCRKANEDTSVLPPMYPLDTREAS